MGFKVTTSWGGGLRLLLELEMQWPWECGVGVMGEELQGALKTSPKSHRYHLLCPACREPTSSKNGPYSCPCLPLLPPAARQQVELGKLD